MRGLFQRFSAVAGAVASVSEYAVPKLIWPSPDHIPADAVGSSLRFTRSQERKARRLFADTRPWRSCFPRVCSPPGIGSCPSVGVHQCSGRGACVLGICACLPGATGVDCAGGSVNSRDIFTESERLAEAPQRRTALPVDMLGSASSLVSKIPNSTVAAATQTQPSNLRIYVYDLPPELGFLPLAAFDANDRLNVAEMSEAHIYDAEFYFFAKLLSDNTTRTFDPHAADLLAAPLFSVHGPANRNLCARGHLTAVATHIQATYPTLWRRHGGRDHVFFLSGDLGACSSGVVAPIIISHWGLLGPQSRMHAYSAQGSAAFASLTEAPAANLAKEMLSSEWCYSPHKDVVIPPNARKDLTQMYTESRVRWRDVARLSRRMHAMKFSRQLQEEQQLPRGHAPDVERLHRHAGVQNFLVAGDDGTARSSFDYLLVHAGGIWGWANTGSRVRSSYSMGMRQRLFELYGDPAAANESGILISSKYLSDAVWSRTRFCLSPAGIGWGIRLSQALMRGCVPLIAQPFVVQPFETLLHYADFSARVMMEDLPTLPTSLRSLQAKHATMQAGVKEAQIPFDWSDDGKAYEYTLVALCHRLTQMRGGQGRISESADGHACSLASNAMPESHRRRAGERLVSPEWFPPRLREATRLAIEQHSFCYWHPESKECTT